jgi:predicted transcriptional regulator YdeE
MDPILPEALNICCALETTPQIPTSFRTDSPNFFAQITIPGGEYLRFIHIGSVNNLAQTYQYIYGQYLAQASIKPKDNWEFQRFRDQDSPLEILIPLSD